MNNIDIYSNILKQTYQDKALDVFILEKKLGEEKIQKILSLENKAKQTSFFHKLPSYENYPLNFVINHVNAVLTKWSDEMAIQGASDIQDFVTDISPEEVGADITVTCFALAKRLGEKVNVTAKKVEQYICKEGISLHGEKIHFTSELSGGYINISLEKNKFTQTVLASVFKHKDNYGASAYGNNKRILIEYSSPNIAKPMSVGHLRSTIIGELLKKIYKYQGYDVISMSYPGDFGTQFGKLLFALSVWKNEEQFKKDPVKEMLRLYVKFHKQAKEDKGLDDKAREVFHKLEQKDPELVKTWLELCSLSVVEFDKIYKKLGVDIDITLGESFYETMLADTLKECIDKNIATQNEDGSVAVNFPDESLPSFLLQKQDGSSLYALRDIAAALFRIKTFTKVEKIIYVVGSEQTLHFRQIFKTLSLLNLKDLPSLVHDSFGLVSLPEGKMSTREGRVVFLDDLLKEAVLRARKIVEKKNNTLPEDEKESIAKAVGVGAVIYDSLAQSRERNIKFTWEHALSLQGNSAPYIQYGYVRAISVLKKADKEKSLPDFENIKNVLFAEKSTQSEQKLIRMLAQFPDIIHRACAHDAPHTIAVYLNALVSEFNRFYAENPILQSVGDIKKTRLAIVKAIAQVIHNGLYLLGVEAPERM